MEQQKHRMHSHSPSSFARSAGDCRRSASGGGGEPEADTADTLETADSADSVDYTDGGTLPGQDNAPLDTDYENLWLTTRVNGEMRQHDTTGNLLFPFRYLIRYLSTFMRLKPGDVISTGTPNGAGARFDPPKYLKPGDVVEVEVPEIGTLVNSVIDE